MGDLTPNFSASEFACKCGCDKAGLDERLPSMLQQLRDTLGRSVSITSGIRCASHNRSVGGVSNSSHVQGIAADISTYNSADRGEKLKAAIEVGFFYIGIGKDFLHLDLRPSESLIVFDYYVANHVA